MAASAPVCGRPARLARLWRGEDGAGTAFGLFSILICLMFAGLAIDATNAWRNDEILRLSADVAAHAGASKLAQGGDRMAALAVAGGATELNTPVAVYGRTIYDPFEDIEALQYDPATNMVSPGGTPNAVSVRLERNARVQNPVPTFLLKLIGRDGWDLSVTSVAAVVPTTRCDNRDGIYSHGKVVLDGEAAVGSKVCIHGQTGVRLAGRSSFESGSGLSMPDLSRCQGGCSEMSSPGYAGAATGMNLIMTDPSALIDRLTAGFADPGTTLKEETAFFALHPLAEDLSALDELAVDTAKLKRGDVVSLSRDMFDRARALPSGLVYRVACQGGEGSKDTVLNLGSGVEALDVQAGADGSEGSDPSGLPAAGETPAAPSGLRGVVVVTDCRVNFTGTARVEGSLILSTRAVPGVAVTAAEGAGAGDPEVRCDASMQSMIMAKGGMEVPAGFTASNTAFVMAGDITVAGDPSGGVAAHRGLSLHAGGAVRMKGQHSFQACGTGLDALLPELNVIKYVIPTDPLVATN